MRYLFGCILMLCLLPVMGQFKEDTQKTFFGLEFKPIFNSDFFTAGAQISTGDNLTYTVQNTGGHSLGMVIRHNVYKKFSLETGINSVTRNYSILLEDDTSNFSVSNEFRMVAYEIPLLGLVYVQTGDQTFINAGAGLSFSFLPTDTEIAGQIDYYQRSFRDAWMRMALLAQIGFEYRTKDSGIFYLGTSLNRPFKNLASSEIKQILDDRNDRKVKTPLTGRFLTLSLRYFFDPGKEKK